ncbi:hypothetical protein [Jannaschia sp. W003]|uniref:hypothetical protein n=1 Tax=Jannaschia sp. W003 TaxID=2867012 RepID=UPI0021A6FCD9|nr:hypothetical protein [Jannaschia sp. W003]UWQ23186.1 hypothetical protein K3554_16735 [Jannaschia sp. W003]
MTITPTSNASADHLPISTSRNEASHHRSISPARRLLRQLRRRLGDAAADAARDRFLKRPFRLLVVCGQKRSGNHLVLQWALSQRRGSCLHYNHVDPAQLPTERHRRTLHRGGGVSTEDALPTLVLSYEDRDLDAVMGGGLGRFLEEAGDRVRNRDLVLAGRDPRNLLASRFRKWPHEHTDPAARARTVARFADYAPLFLDPPETVHDMQFTPIFFDALIASRPYRDTVSDRLELRRGDRGLGEVPAYGHGSSFDGVASDGRSLEVDARWKAYADDPVFREVFATPPMDTLVPAFSEAIALRRGMQ